MRIAASVICLLLLTSSSLAQTQTTGGISGTVRDQNQALIVGAAVAITSQATGEARATTTGETGSYTFALLSPGVYRVRIEGNGFNPFIAETITVNIVETVLVNATLTVAGIRAETVTVNNSALLIRTDSATLGQVIDGRTIGGLPLATRNFTQLIGLVPGATTYLTDNTVVGRNTQNFSVNGSRISQNNFQINGIDVNRSNAGALPLPLANPAPESIAEFKVQTSLYDATFGRAGGGNIQIITKSGTNKFHGAIYDYFRNTELTANNPFLKAVGLPRPVLERNVFGGALGGTLRKDRVFFFVSYQTTRERNGASRLNSLSTNVLIAPGLTDDRSAATLRGTFGVLSIHPTALALLNARLPNGQFVIPTPQANGRYSGSAISLFREEQFNTNFDYRLAQRNWFSVKFFFSNAPTSLARSGNINVPGFAVEQKQDNRLLSVQDIHTFSSKIINEVRIGYNFIRGFNFSQQPLKDSDLGITRSTANVHPGLPAISIAPNAGGISIGTGALQASQTIAPTTSLSDTISITRGRHALRLGAEIRYYESNSTGHLLTRGIINFQSFTTFLTGTTQTAILANGIRNRSFRTTDYNFFAQDDWKVSPRLTLNLGLRYELDLPPYDTRGRISTFDPSLYRPRMLIVNGVPAGPPVVGFVQAGNAIAQYDLPEVPNVSKRVLNSIDPNNFAPRLGFAYSPFKSNSFVVRGGYGIFYSRSSFQYVGNTLFSPPFYFTSTTMGLNVSDPFANVGSEDQFPRFVIGSPLFGNAFDRNNRTPYVQQYNFGVQFGLSKNTLLEVAYVGTRGENLFRQIAINQARLASPQNPISNEVTGAVITTNTPANAQLRAPFQGVALGSGFLQDETSGQSTYNSLQASLTRRFARGLQFLASYTFAKSIDDGSGTGGGAGTNGVLNTVQINDTDVIVGNQLDNRANRGVSNFDRTHRFVLSFLWELPKPPFANGSKAGRLIVSGWQMSGIVTGMSGLPTDIVDGAAGTFYLGNGGGGGRPNFAPGSNAATARTNVPPGYYFNPFAFARAIVLNGQTIPSSNGTSIANATGTDFGTVGRNPLRGPRQVNLDLSILKRFRLAESKNIELRGEVFNLFNNVNFANPISNFAAVQQSGGAIDANTGQILPGRAGDFGKIISTSNSPRIIQLAVKFNF